MIALAILLSIVAFILGDVYLARSAQRAHALIRLANYELPNGLARWTERRVTVAALLRSVR